MIRSFRGVFADMHSLGGWPECRLEEQPVAGWMRAVAGSHGVSLDTNDEERRGQ